MLILVTFTLNFDRFVVINILPSVTGAFRRPMAVIKLLMAVFTLICTVDAPLVAVLVKAHDLLGIRLML